MINTPWKIVLLGGLQIQEKERVITRFKSQKVGALLAYLAYHLPQMHSREVLIEMFWPESDLEAGRNSLSVALSSLRNQLEPPGTPANGVIRADRFSVGLNPASLTTDVLQFETTLQRSAKAGSANKRLPLLAEAIALYPGRLLPGYYEAWIVGEQERLAGLYFDSVEQLLDLLETAGDLNGALQAARRAVSLDPLHEKAQQNLIRLLAAGGQPGAALRQYKEWELRLEAELGDEPSAPLRTLIRQIEKQSGLSGPITLPVVSPLASAVSGLSAFPVQNEPVTLTFLMTEMESAPPTGEGATPASQRAQNSRETLLREVVHRHGQEIRAISGSFLIAFASAGKALDCAVAAQLARIEQDESLRVRMSIHTGDVERTAGDYRGPTLDRVTRILAATHGGQILCSEETASLVRRKLEEGVQLLDLGLYRLQSAPTPERLFQVIYPGMEDRSFPPLTAETGQTANLPLRFTRFFGRSAEIERLVAGLQPTDQAAPSSPRLITLTGAGGSGKTRLALEVAEQLVDAYHGAVWFVPLADLSDSHLLPEALLAGMNILRSPSQQPLDQIVEALQIQPSLLVLDNLEHLIDNSAVLVRTLLERVPTLRCLTTSRQLLGLSGEQEFAVPPLPTPNGDDTPQQLSLFASVQLFVDRAQTSKPDFQVTNRNAASVAELCDRLEGLPLAIELAAARALVLTPAQMLTQLDQRFEFLVTRKRGIAERQRTLHATVDWSYRLLTPELQRFFIRLSVFRSGWTAEAAEAICEEPLALDYLAQLRECSLVLAEETDETIRFRMLETIREYAQEHLHTTGETEFRCRKHRDYFLPLAEEKGAKVYGENPAEVLPWFTREYSNLSGALLWCGMHPEEALDGLKLATALTPYWRLRGYLREGRTLMQAALSRFPSRTVERVDALDAGEVLAGGQSDQAHSRVLLAEAISICREIHDQKRLAYLLIRSGLNARLKGEYQEARACHEESLTIYRELGNFSWIGVNLQNLGDLASTQENYIEAEALYRELLALGRHQNEPLSIASALMCLGGLASVQKDPSMARNLAEEARAIYRTAGNRRQECQILHLLGKLSIEQGDLTSALSYFEESQKMSREWNDQTMISFNLLGIGKVACLQEDYRLAHRMYSNSLEIHRDLGDPYHVGRILENFAMLATAEGRVERAVRLYGATEPMRDNVHLPNDWEKEIKADMEFLRDQQSQEQFELDWQAGTSWKLEQALGYALSEQD